MQDIFDFDHKFNPKALKFIRTAKGLTHRVVAKNAGMHFTALIAVEDCKIDPTNDMILRLANALDCDISDLFAPEQEFDERDYFKNLLKSAMGRLVESPKHYDVRMALEIYRELYEVEEEEDILGTANAFSWEFYRNPTYSAFNSPTAKEILNYIHSSNNAKLVISGPTRTAKTLFDLDVILGLMFSVPNFQVLALRSDAVDLRDTVRKSIKELVRFDFDHPNSPFIVKGGMDDFHTLVLPNGSAMVLGGMNRPGRVLGTAYDAIFYSQIEMSDDDQFRKLMTRISSPAGNWKDENGNTRYLFIGDANPDRLDNHLLEKKKNGEIEWFEFGFHDNPKFVQRGEKTPQYREVDELEQNLIHSKVHYDRYFLGKWGNPEGSVFIINDKNIITSAQVPSLDQCDIYRAQDYGMKHPSINLWIAVHKETKNRYVYREWRRTHTDYDIMADEVIAYSEGETISNTVIEIDERAQNTMRDKGIDTTMVEKGPGSILNGILLINAALRKAQEGKDGGLFIVDNSVCNNDPNPDVDPEMRLVKEMQNAVFNENKDAPIDENDDATDAYRYFELWFSGALETFDPVVNTISIPKEYNW